MTSYEFNGREGPPISQMDADSHLWVRGAILWWGGVRLRQGTGMMACIRK